MACLRGTFSNCTRYCESSKSLKGDRGRNRVQRCCLLTSFQDILEGDRGRDRVQWCRLINKKVHTRNCSCKDFFQNSASKMAHCTIVDIVNYLINVITGKLLATHF